MTDQEKKLALSKKRKAHRATPCDNCGHSLGLHHCLGKCKSANCRCKRFLSVVTRQSHGKEAAAGSRRQASAK